MYSSLDPYAIVTNPHLEPIDNLKWRKDGFQREGQARSNHVEHAALVASLGGRSRRVKVLDLLPGRVVG